MNERAEDLGLTEYFSPVKPWMLRHTALFWVFIGAGKLAKALKVKPQEIEFEL